MVEMLNKITMKNPTACPAPSDEAAHAAFVSLMTFFGASKQQLNERLRSAHVEGLGPLHMRLLCLCVEQPGCTQQHLARQIGRDKGQVAHLIHALEGRGLLARAPDAHDGRILRLSATAAGQQNAEQFVAIETEFAQQLFHELSATEFAQLQELARKLLAASKR